ncbi:MAG: O-antigen ligase family protein [Hyphomicrobiaceae bacterium]|nr:O-antigen ligase family protein [Hyphomicrobiaceae bacterium]
MGTFEAPTENSHPLLAQAPTTGGMLLEWSFALLCGLAVAVPRASWVLLGLLCLSIAVSRSFMARRYLWSDALSRLSGLDLAAWAAIPVLALVSTLWSLDPGASASKGALLLLLLAAFTLSYAAIRQTDRSILVYVLRGVAFGVVFGTAYLALELYGNGLFSRTMYNSFGWPFGIRVGPAGHLVKDGRSVGLYAGALNRNTVVATALLFPVLLAFLLWRPRSWRAVAGALVIWAFAASTIMRSYSETSKLGLTVGTIVAVGAMLHWRTMLLLVKATWFTACLLSLPAVFLFLNLGLQHHEPIKSLHQIQRLRIYESAATEYLKAPLIGVGARSSAVVQNWSDDQESAASTNRARIQVHPHSVYLEAWLDLGAVGAVLLWLLGHRILTAIARQPRHLRELLLAHFATIAAVIAPSYSMWQLWFVAGALLSALISTACVAAFASRAPAPD